jgi:hypothetical protein
MSGFLQPRIQDELRAAFAEKDPRLCKHYYIDNDSPGAPRRGDGSAGLRERQQGAGSHRTREAPPS